MVTSTSFPDTPPNTGLSELISPTIALPSGVSKLTFQNLFNTEGTYDGMVLEISINGGAFQDMQRISVTLANVSDGANLGNVMVPLGVLAGDTNGNGAVTGTDVSQTKAAASGAMTVGTFRTDVNAGGSINATDISIVKSRTGTPLP